MKEFFRVRKDNLSKGDKVFLYISSFFGALLLFFFIIYSIYKKNSLKELESENNYGVTICRVSGYGLKFNRNIFDYMVKDKEYRCSYHNTEPLYVGERYNGKYKLSDPDIILVDITEPVIDTIKYSKSTCTISEIDSFHDMYLVKYHYNINGVKYIRSVYVDNKVKLHIGSIYNILYNIRYPKVSYLDILLN
jgi:hypothetical protein